MDRETRLVAQLIRVARRCAKQQGTAYRVRLDGTRYVVEEAGMMCRESLIVATAFASGQVERYQ
jgi:hypothetical protein